MSSLFFLFFPSSRLDELWLLTYRIRDLRDVSHSLLVHCPSLIARVVLYYVLVVVVHVQ